MRTRLYIKISLCLWVLFGSIIPLTHAVEVSNTYTLLAPLPNLSSQSLELKNKLGFDDYVQYVFNLAVAIGAVAAVFMITLGGFEYMTSDAVNTKKEGLRKLKNAVLGLVIILSSVLIMRTISPKFALVPKGLVPAANLEQPKDNNGVANWLDDLEQQIIAHNINDAQIASSLDSARKENADLITQENDIAKQISDYSNLNPTDACGSISYGNDDPKLKTMCDEWLNNQYQQSQVKTSAFTTVNQKTISSFSGEALKQPGLIGEQQINDLNSIYEKAKDDAVLNGVSLAEFTPVSDSYYLADSQLRAAYVNNSDGSPAIQTYQLNSIINNDIPKVTDPETKNAMIDSVASQIKMLESESNMYYSNQYNNMLKQVQSMKTTQ